MEQKTTKNPFWFFLFAALVIGSALLFLYETTTSANKESATASIYQLPPDMEEIIERVAVEKDLSYAEIENSVLDIYYPKELKEIVPVILWIHGGGYVGGSKNSRQPYAMALSDAGYVVANMDYALAPQQLYPGPILQANAVMQFLEDHVARYGGDMDRFYIGGDSAGAQIASQLAAMITNPELSSEMDISLALQADQLRGTILHCGLYNMDTVRATGFPSIDFFLSTYTGQEVFETFPRIDELSTVKHVTPDYPPVFLTVGDGDPFASQSHELSAVLQKNEVPVTTVFFDGTNKQLQHEFQYALQTPEAQETLLKTIQFLNDTSN